MKSELQERKINVAYTTDYFSLHLMQWADL